MNHMPLSLSVSYRFNRYMVECELQKEKQHYFAVLVLIDTWWNVNEVRRCIVRYGTKF